MNTTRVRTIGILTGGGDVPGLNPCIKQLVVRATELGMKVVGIRKGWEGLLAYTPDDPFAGNYVQPLDAAGVRTIDRSGGTILHTSRTNPSAVKLKDAPAFLKGSYVDPSKKQDFTAQVLKTISQLGIDVLVPIGGDDTL
ncbi:MAG: 6-phosphofructokinase, partial [Desulfatitalea sp.]|nr:6-phosphofructokinase [Desulfatitalea sp.]